MSAGLFSGDLKKAAHDYKHVKETHYRLVFETLRGKLDQPNDQFRNFIFPLLGDKDHEKVLDVVAKVEKNNMRQMRKSPGQSGGVLKNRSYPSSWPLRRCFYCNRPGHIKANCFQRRKDSDEFSVKNDKKTLALPGSISNFLKVSRISIKFSQNVELLLRS